MKEFDLKKMTGGWCVGDFNPSLLKRSDIEVGVKKYKKGEINKAHFHKMAIEYTIVVYGTIKMNSNIYEADAVIEIDYNEVSDFEAISDCCVVVIKSASIKDDKYNL